MMRLNIRLFAIVFVYLLLYSVSSEAATPYAPFYLRVDYVESSLGITNAEPVFSWLMKDDDRGERQTAYEIIVASSYEKLSVNAGDTWSTGWVQSDRQSGIPYGGKAFTGKTDYYWKVRLKDKDGHASPFSAPATFETGIIGSPNWQARWIYLEDSLQKPVFDPRTVNYKDSSVHPLYDAKNWTGDTWLGLVQGKLVRKEFHLSRKPIQKARAYIANLGYYELRINGKKVGDHVLDPGMTDCTKRVLCVTYDVSDFLQAGDNAIGIMLSAGRLMNCANACKMELEITFADGSTQVIVTDTSWKGTTDAPFKSLINWGISKELFDATRVQAGWDQKQFDDRSWQTLKDKDLHLAIDAQLEPIRVIQTLKPTEMLKVSDSVYTFNMGQNFSGWTRIHVKGPVGKIIKVQYSDDSKRLMDFNQEDTYVLSGNGMETFEPRFTYHGFQWVTIIGYPGVPTLESIEGRVVHTDVRNAGEFTCSDQLLNQLYNNNKWTLRSNLHSVYTDCPSREKVPWLGQWAQEDLSNNFDMAAFFIKWQQDLAAGQMSNGRIADKVPGRIHYGSNGTDPVWVSEAVVGTWDIYRVYGDLQQLRRSYPMLQKLADYYKSIADTSYIITQNIWGDYIGLDKPEPAFLSTIYFYQVIKTMSSIAAALSRPEDAASYKMFAEKIGRSIHNKFYHNGGYSNNSQGANAAALHFGIVPAALIPKVLERLETAFAEKNYHVSTGGATTYNLMNTLWLYDKTALAYKLATQKTFPGWGFWVANGATTSWEQWPVDNGSSKNHGWLGSYLNTWLCRAIGGISALEPGYKAIKLIPGNVADLRFAKSSLETIRGNIVFEWSKTSAGGLIMFVTIPANSRADLYIPRKGLIFTGERDGFLYRKGRVMNPSKYIVRKGNKAAYAVFGVGSGTYQFTVMYK